MASTPQYIVEIKETLEKIAVDLTEIKVSNAKRDANDENIARLVLKHEQDLNGNGKAGLKSDMEIVKRDLRRIVYAVTVIGLAIASEIVKRVFGL